MATGTGNLPNPTMSFSPFAILTAEELNNFVENIESLADGSGIGDDALSNLTGEAWASWTPTFTNLSGGSLAYARYTKVGKTIKFRMKYNFTGANASGLISFAPPVAQNSEYSENALTRNPIGIAVYRDDSANALFTGLIYFSGTGGDITLVVNNAASTYTTVGGVTNTIPFTWASGDYFSLEGSYEAA